MPEAAPIAKAEAASALGRTCDWSARPWTSRWPPLTSGRAPAGWRSCIPFDDPEVIAGQGGLGLELLAQVPDLARVMVPVGGGGLVSGVAVAIKSERPESR